MLTERLLTKLASAFVSRGTLRIETETGHVITAGNGTAPEVAVRLSGRGASRWLLADPEFAVGELYSLGRLTLEKGTLDEMFQLLFQDSHGSRDRLLLPIVRTWHEIASRFSPSNGPDRSRRNVGHHYERPAAFYDLFLDLERQYSCAYFESDDQSLDDAQRAKQRHVAAKLLIETGHDVLDIGSGWGGLAFYLAGIAEAGRVKGVTLSEEQARQARAGAAARGLDRRVDFEIRDYRTLEDHFDRIVSIGMFEHVGQKNHADFFANAARLLAPDGIMLLHTIGVSGEPGYTNPWIRKRIFPGGHLPSLSEMLAAIEQSGLIVTDVEVLRLHYARTLRHWRQRFAKRRSEAAAAYGEQFCRAWEFYLAASEAAFRWEGMVVFQVQLAKRNDVVPLRRDYIAEREAILRRRELSLAKPLAAGG